MNRFTIIFSFLLILIAVQLYAQVPSANLKLWLKADAGTSTTTNGQSVSTWADQSGNGNNATQPTAANQPTYTTSTLNGYPALHFTSANDSYLILPTDSALGIQNSDYEMFIVARTDSTNISFLISGNLEQFEMHLNGAAGARFIPISSTYIDEGTSGEYANNSPHIFDAQASSTEGLIRVDGVNGGNTLTNVRSSSNSSLILGMRLSVNSYFFTGDIAEVIIYNKVLSASDRILVESYLASKYGISYSNFAVTNTTDADTGSYNTGTLRYVLNAINTNASSNTAYVDMTGISGTITLTSALPAINYNTTLTGPGPSSLTINGNNLYRPFFIGDGVSPFSSTAPASPEVTLQNFTISNGYGVGGNGINGGGGAAGMGGALFINSGTVLVNNLTFSGNKAAGGIGGNYYGTVTGGGGGFGGSAIVSGGGSSGLLGGIGGGNGGDLYNVDGYPGGFGGGGGEGFDGGGGNGGSGGFGGGGGSGSNDWGGGGFAGAGGFGAGYGGANYGGGGGGAGLGGAIFNNNGAMVIENCIFNNDTAAGGTGVSANGTSYGGAVFNYSGSYLFSNDSFGTGANANSSANSSDYYIYSGNIVLPTASILPVTNLTGSSATINGSVNTNDISTSYRFIYGTNPSALADTLGSQSAGSSGTVDVSANLTSLTAGTFYYFRILTSNSYGSDTSSLGSFIYDTSISSTNLKLWLASDSGVDTSGGKVSEWFDKSGNSNNATQSTSADEPSYQASVINSKPALSFDGTSTYLALPSAASLGLQNSDYEMFIVAKSSSSSLQFVEGGTAGNYELQLNGSSGARFIPAGSNYLDEGNSNDYTNGLAHIFELKASSSEGIIRVDGSAGGYVLSNTQSSDAGNLVIGRRGDGSYFFNGDIAEIIIYNANLTSSQRLAVANYLSQKYNITYTTVSTPTIQASNMTISNVTNNSINLQVTKGNGAQRIIIGKSGSAVDTAPSNGQVYTASSVFGSGSQLGTGNYVVYQGTDSVVTVTGLSSHTDYYFSAYEFNGTNTDQNYLTTSPATGNFTTNYTPPTDSILSDSAITGSSMYFRGIVNPNGASSTYRFAYGTSPDSLIDSTSVQNAGSGSSADTVRMQITGLAYGTVYYEELTATNSGGTSTSSVYAAITDTSLSSTNLKLWLRSDEATSSTKDSTSVSTWYDVSGNLNNAEQSTPADEPLYRTSGIDSKPALSFDGSSSYLSLPISTSLGIQNSDYEMFIVAKSSSTNTQFIAGGTPGNYELQLNGGQGARFIPAGSIYLDEGNSNDYTNGQAHIFDIKATSSEGVIHVDGSAGGYVLSNTQSSDAGVLDLGRRGNASLYFNGDIAEVIVYNSNLSLSQRQSITQYLSQRYNIPVTTVTEPTVQASNVSFSNVKDVSMSVKVNKGNGAYRLILAKSGSAVDSAPTDGQAYTADSIFGLGSQIGTGNFVVYSGSDSVVTISGLSGSTTYYFSVFEYNGTNTDQNYLTVSPVTGSQQTTVPFPVVTLQPDSILSSTSVILRGDVNPSGTAATYKFYYGTNVNSLIDSTASLSAGSGSTTANVSATLTGLITGNIYYYKLESTNTGGTSVSSVGEVGIDTSITKTSLKLWLRADDGVTGTIDSTDVGTWYDASGNLDNATEYNSAAKPLYRTNQINGKSALVFNGSASRLNLQSSSAIGIQNSDYEIFIVAKSSYTAQPEFLFSGTGAQYEIQLNGVGVRYIPLTTTTYIDEGTAGEYSDGNAHVFEVRASSSGGAVSVDGLDGGTSATDLRNPNDVSISIGTRQDSTYAFNGDIAEIIIYDSLLSSSDRSKVEQYLANKYNISSGALPIEMVTFTANNIGDKVELSWNTATEVNNFGFEVQRAIQNSKVIIQNWNDIGFVKGSGNSNSPKKYSFIDSNPIGGNNFEYRIKQIDNNGQYKYSKVVDLKLIPAQFELYQNYPNPFNPTTTIKYDLPVESRVVLKLYDVLGQEVATLLNTDQQAGIYNFQLSSEKYHLASGVYIYRLQAGKYNAIKKFVLLK